ncbi:MAG TPA: hypothetical protein ENN43_02950 [bacterium]|nr:hypothetical protein [bacterium]
MKEEAKEPVETGLAPVSEGKVVKREQQAPGVVTEYMEDGTKVVTINLSEIDEDSLPEKYVAEVILEAPILESSQADSKTRRTPAGTFQAGEEGRLCYQDVSIDGKGNIYILDSCNASVTVYNNQGKMTGIIPVENVYSQNEDGRVKSHKTEIKTGGNRIYLRDTVKNRIEAIDEAGKVLETIDIPEEIEGKRTREMRMWADEEGVGVGSDGRKSRFEKGKWVRKESAARGENRERREEKNQMAYAQVLNNVIKLNQDTLRLESSVLRITEMGNDNSGNKYFRVSAGKKEERGVLKYSDAGQVKVFIRDTPFWWDEKWKDGCEQILPFLSGGIAANVLLSKNGTVYLTQRLCCSSEANCVSKIRIIAFKKR